MNEVEYTIADGDEFAAVIDPNGSLSVRITNSIWLRSARPDRYMSFGAGGDDRRRMLALAAALTELATMHTGTPEEGTDR